MDQANDWNRRNTKIYRICGYKHLTIYWIEFHWLKRQTRFRFLLCLFTNSCLLHLFNVSMYKFHLNVFCFCIIPVVFFYMFYALLNSLSILIRDYNKIYRIYRNGDLFLDNSTNWVYIFTEMLYLMKLHKNGRLQKYVLKFGEFTPLLEINIFLIISYLFHIILTLNQIYKIWRSTRKK